MGLKKTQKVENNKIKCPYFDRGFCQNRDECKDKHPKKICDDENCDENLCQKRHPNPCKFGFRCKFFKKNLCLFSHVPFASNDEKTKHLINKLIEKVESFDRKIQGLSKKMGLGFYLIAQATK